MSTTTIPTDLDYRPVQPADLERVFELESCGFDPEEAASLETIRYRHSVAPELFIGAYHHESLIGFVNATRSITDSLDHQSITHDDRSGKHVLIHSVCVDRKQHRQKVASGLLQHFIDRCREHHFSSIVLVCHPELKLLYLAAGFVDRGPSTLVHGPREWWEMAIKLDDPQTNTSRLLCPVERCRCVIIRKDVARLITRSSCPLPERSNSSPGKPTRCWLVPSPTSFDNIGFSKPIGRSNGASSAAETRWLSCGACDFGPIGWTESSSNLADQFSSNPTGGFGNVLFLLDCDRVHAS